jgi:TPR repeat protein
LNDLGYFCREGLFRRKNIAEATKYYCQAAEAGHPRAMYNLAFFCENGIGMDEDVTRALQWYEKAAALGHKKAARRLKYRGWV